MVAGRRMMWFVSIFVWSSSVYGGGAVCFVKSFLYVRFVCAVRAADGDAF